MEDEYRDDEIEYLYCPDCDYEAESSGFPSGLIGVDPKNPLDYGKVCPYCHEPV